VVLRNYLSHTDDDGFADISRLCQLDFQQPGVSTMDSIIELHHDIMFIVFFIISFITYLLCRAVYLFEYSVKKPSNRVKHSTTLEVVWTIIPAIILGWIALPSFSLLYAMDNVIDPKLTVKTIGHQWYWSYENIDPEYMRNALNHPEIYRNYVDIIKRFEVPTGDSYIEDCEYNNVSLRYFLKQLVIRDLREGYKGPEDYLKLVDQVKEIHNITPEQEIIID
jgi:heme/copper-type cytochrome/quinol oxidase subunit 2